MSKTETTKKIKTSFLIDVSTLIEYAFSKDKIDIRYHFFDNLTDDLDMRDGVCEQLGVEWNRDTEDTLAEAIEQIKFEYDDFGWEWEEGCSGEAESVRVPIIITVDMEYFEAA